MDRYCKIWIKRLLVMNKYRYVMNSAVAVSLSIYFSVLIIFCIIVLSLVLLPGWSYWPV